VRIKGCEEHESVSCMRVRGVKEYELNKSCLAVMCEDLFLYRVVAHLNLPGNL
jgi:hypothetical protein